MRSTTGFLLLALSIFCSACQTRNVPKDIEAFVNQTVMFPDKLQPVLNGRATTNLNLLDAEIKLVVWMDSTGCTSCALQHMDPWYDITNYTSQFGEKIKVIFILSPKYEDRKSIDLSTMLFRYPMYIDRDYSFPALNPTLPKDRRLHVFLLNRKDQVILIGNPIGNDALWDLYKQQIDIMLQDAE